jgi:hypothetical protein
VLDGTPDHRDALLTEDERATGDTMPIRVSRSRGPDWSSICDGDHFQQFTWTS